MNHFFCFSLQPPVFGDGVDDGDTLFCFVIVEKVLGHIVLHQ